jgi:hypothetical protein
MKHWFTQHPHAVNETYLQHCCFSLKSAGRLLITALGAILHAFFPFLCVFTTSQLIAKMTGDYCKGVRREDFLTKVNRHLHPQEQCYIKRSDESC